MSIRFARRLILAALGAAVVASPALAQTKCEDPKVLRFSLVPTQDSVRELTYYKPIMDQLSKNTGKKIEFYMPTSYSSVVEALLGKWVDVAVLGPESYVIAKSKEPTVEVFGTYSRLKNGIQEAGPGYKAVLITKKGGKYPDIASLKGSVVALVDPASTSGGLVPEFVFPKDNKLPPLKDYFSKVVYSGGHDLGAIAVSEGKVDAAFVATHRFMETVNAGKVKQDEFNYLWYSPLLPQDPFVYRNTLCDDLKAKIANTFLHGGPERRRQEVPGQRQVGEGREDDRRRLQRHPRRAEEVGAPMSAVMDVFKAAAAPAAAAGAAVLRVQDLKVSYTAGKEILKGISFDVGPEEFVAIIGPSGAGKSTLIRCVNRLVDTTAGSVWFGGQDLLTLNEGAMRAQRRNIGMIFQEFNLIDRLSVIDNVLTGRLGYMGNLRSMFRAYTKPDIAKAVALLDRVGLIDHMDKRADALSGGQRQRVGIARALIQEPKLLLVDEPTSALDPKISREVMGMIRGIAREFKVPVLCNIHDVDLALEFCDRIIGLQDGIKKFDGPPSSVDKHALADIYAMEVL